MVHSFILILLLFGNSDPDSLSVQRLNEFLDKGYAYVINQTDTLYPQKIYLDDDFDHQWMIDTTHRIIHYYTQQNPEYDMMSYDSIEHLYKGVHPQIAFIVYKGELVTKEKQIYFQRSLIKKPLILDHDSINTNSIFCRALQGHIIVFD